MPANLISVGFGNMVASNRIISIVHAGSAPTRRVVQEARDKGMLVDATCGRKARAVVITDSNHVILSAVQPETIAQRLGTKNLINEVAGD